MELVNQHTKKIMEGCKERAREVGLKFTDESLEYIVTNRDLLELTPKLMIPTLYDYWVHDVEVLREKGRYELYPNNPYETVINTRPPISFYNDNNPDWLNVMIFYHVLAHIDFMQNNLYYQYTWDYDFNGQALSDKRLIAKLRSEKGRWVDYTIEFARGIDNLVGYYSELSKTDRSPQTLKLRRFNYYFDIFLQNEIKTKISEYIKEVERYNKSIKEYNELGDETFFSEVRKKYPEFEALFKKNSRKKSVKNFDLLQFIIENSSFLNKEENRWMKSVVQVIRKTSLFFQPQIRTKIMNEGWASYWHEKLFLNDDRIKGHEVDFARVHSWVASLARVGLNPYALGMRLFYYIEELADKGKYCYDFQKILDIAQREKYDKNKAEGQQFIFKVRENFCDYTFIDHFVDQDFMKKYKLFVAGKRLNRTRMVWEYYVKSRKAEDYRQMLFDHLYHPPHIEIKLDHDKNNSLYLLHHFEGKPLVIEYIANTLMGLEYLWGAPVHLETSEIKQSAAAQNFNSLPHFTPPQIETENETEISWERVIYTMKNRKLTKKKMD